MPWLMSSSGRVNHGCTSSRYASAITASSNASASQRSRRVGGIAIGNLRGGRGGGRGTGQRLQLGGEGEAVTAGGAAIGLQHAGQVDLAPQR
ncbi:hypothetical protein D9M71_761710 [compost metagenome]